MGFELTLVPKVCSSNKPKNPVNLVIEVGKREKGPTPFIDRLSVTLKVPSKEEGQDIRQAYFAAIADSHTFKHARPSKGYKRAKRIMLDSVLDSTKWPFFEVCWDENAITKIRLDLIPVDLGSDGLFELHVALSSLVPGGWKYVLKHAKITRHDVAVDLTGSSMDDFHPLPTTTVMTTRRNRHGTLQTIELGGPKGNQTAIYDRKAKRVAKGKPWQGKEGVRVERRLRGSCGKLSDLGLLANPFASLALIARKIPKPDSETNIGRWLRFCASVEVYSLNSAIALLPVGRRKAYRAHLKLCEAGLWDPQKLWVRWKSYLADTEIVDATAWT